jgi:hypothetical protein
MIGHMNEQRCDKMSLMVSGKYVELVYDFR